MFGFSAKELVAAFFSLLTLVTPFRVTSNGKYFPLRLEKRNSNKVELKLSCEQKYIASNSQTKLIDSDKGSSDSLTEGQLDSSKIEKVEKKDNEFIALDISSDSQYWEGEDIFIAQGNAIASINGGKLYGDFFRFDKSKKILIAKGNITFVRGSQNLNASYFKYNLNNHTGFAKDIYGVINIDNLENDFRLNSSESTLTQDKHSQNINDYSLRRFDRKGSLSFQRGLSGSTLDPYGQEKSINGSINSWRLQSECINFDKEGWFSDELSLTNDPFSPAQNRIIAREVRGKEDEDGVFIISSNKGRLVIEETIKIPTGKREYGREGNQQRWIFAYDKKDRDGLYVGLQSDTLDLGFNQELTLQPQFLIQRAVLGDTEAYPDSDKSITSKKIKSTAEFSDLFGLEAKLTGKVLNWDSEINANISTFNADRFFYGSRYSGSLKKRFTLGKIDNVEANLFSAYRYRTWNGTLGESDIHTAVGAFLEKRGGWEKGSTDYSYVLRSGLANYQAEKLNSKDLITLWKASLFGSLNTEYPLITFKTNNSSRQYAASNSALPLHQGITFNTITNIANFYYEDGSNQASLKFSAGPRLTFGNFKAPILDYTSISIMPGFTVKAGDSPFKFDNANDLQIVSLDLTQRIFGPLVLVGDYDINVDPGSSYYLESINSKVSVLIERRSYGFGIFYDIKNKRGGIQFRLKGFDFSGPSEPIIPQNKLETNNKFIDQP